MGALFPYLIKLWADGPYHSWQRGRPWRCAPRASSQLLDFQETAVVKSDDSARHVISLQLGRPDHMQPPRPFPETRPSLLVTLRGDGPVQSAWREFFHRYAPPLYRVARRQGLGAEDADDIVQQVMVAVSAHIGEFRYDRDRGRFRQWVKTIAANKIRDLFRHRQAAPDRVSLSSSGLDCPSDRPGIGELWESEWRAQDLLWCLDQVRRDIAPRRYEAFELYVLQGVSAEDTGRRLGMTKTHVYVTRTQVVKRIRELMKQLDREADAEGSS